MISNKKKEMRNKGKENIITSIGTAAGVLGGQSVFSQNSSAQTYSANEDHIRKEIEVKDGVEPTSENDVEVVGVGEERNPSECMELTKIDGELEVIQVSVGESNQTDYSVRSGEVQTERGEDITKAGDIDIIGTSLHSDHQDIPDYVNDADVEAFIS